MSNALKNTKWVVAPMRKTSGAMKAPLMPVLNFSALVELISDSVARDGSPGLCPLGTCPFSVWRGAWISWGGRSFLQQEEPAAGPCLEAEVAVGSQPVDGGTGAVDDRDQAVDRRNLGEDVDRVLERTGLADEEVVVVEGADQVESHVLPVVQQRTQGG